MKTEIILTSLIKKESYSTKLFPASRIYNCRDQSKKNIDLKKTQSNLHPTSPDTVHVTVHPDAGIMGSEK